MTTKIHFCPQCAIMLQDESKEIGKCDNCGCDLTAEGTIIGEFADDDAKHLQSMEA